MAAKIRHLWDIKDVKYLYPGPVRTFSVDDGHVNYNRQLFLSTVQVNGTYTDPRLT